MGMDVAMVRDLLESESDLEFSVFRLNQNPKTQNSKSQLFVFLVWDFQIGDILVR